MKQNCLRFFILFMILSVPVFVSCKEETDTKETDIEEIDDGSYKVGDIVLSDGVRIRFSDRNSITEEQKEMAAGVIYFVYDPDSTGEISTYIKQSENSDVKKIKALAITLKHQRLTSWARMSTTGYKTDFTGIKASELKAGTEAWSVIYNALNGKTLSKDDYLYEFDGTPDAEPLYDEEDGWYITERGNGIFEQSNYPVFYYANSYAEENSLSDISFAGGFHIPSLAEFEKIADNIKTVQGSLDAVVSDMSLASLGRFWTSNQADDASSADVYNFSTGSSSSASKSTETQAVTAFALY